MSGTTNGPGPYAETDRRRSTASVVDADVIVVGAGPAGSATATHLARHGLRVCWRRVGFRGRRSAATVSRHAAPDS